MIFLITGLMASGKSTTAQLLAENLPKAVHLRGDVFRKMVVSGRADMSENPSEDALAQLDLRYRLAAMSAKEYCAAGFDVVVQDNYYGKALPFMLELLAPLPVFAVVLCPNVRVIMERESARGKIGYGNFAVQSLYDDFHLTTPRVGFWLDNSDISPQEAVRQILSKAGKQPYSAQ